MSARGDLPVLPGLVIPADELAFDAVRSGGPGGQNVNKVASAVILRFRLDQSRVLDSANKARLREHLASRMNSEGEIVVRASEHRQQGRNLDAARERLAVWIANALTPARPRIATRPGRGARRRRREIKQRVSRRKRDRRTRSEE